MLPKIVINRNKANAAGETGAALAIAIITLTILAVIGLTALTFSSTEARIAGNDMQRTQTFYAATTGLEKMTNDFSNLFQRKMNPTDDDLYTIAHTPPSEMQTEGFSFDQSLAIDTPRLTQLQNTQGLPANIFPRVNISEGPYAGLYASIVPYTMSSTATMNNTGTQIKLEREFNNYLIPLFQFGVFSNDDLKVHPGPLLTLNGRVHTNGNLYALSSTKFLNRVTTAGELVRDAMRDGEANLQGGNGDVHFDTAGVSIQSTIGNGSVKASLLTVGGPNIVGSSPGSRDFYPSSPNGAANPSWYSESVKPSTSGVPNRFGGQLLTQTTGATKLKPPLELSGNSPAEIIKRSLSSDDDTKAQIRILIDDETAGSGSGNVAGIQTLSQHENFCNVNYSPPLRNWSFDSSFLTPNKLPPGAPFFQYVQATGFRQSLR